MTQLADYHYHLPDELIAQAPLANRSDSRLLVLNGHHTEHLDFRQLPHLLRAGDRLVFNNTRVIPARLSGHKLSGGKVEFMLERFTGNNTVLAKIRASKSPKAGAVLVLESNTSGAIANNADSGFRVEVTGRQDDLFELKGNAENNPDVTLSEFIARNGEIPLPPYIQRKPDEIDHERYQTVYAKAPGAVAAPTAGLHFDNKLLETLSKNRIDQSYITLHVGAGTFQPVRVSDITRHTMHAERAEVTQRVVDEVNETKSRGGRVFAVGTTCVRSLEAAAASGELTAFNGETRLFITPGFTFNVIDAMITNFHLPESTLLMLVAAFAGRGNTLAAYHEAVERQYRFFSYGDAMMVFPAIDSNK